MASSVIIGFIAADLGFIDSRYETEWRSELLRDVAISVVQRRGGNPVGGDQVMIEKTDIVDRFKATGASGGAWN